VESREDKVIATARNYTIHETN